MAGTLLGNYPHRFDCNCSIVVWYKTMFPYSSYFCPRHVHQHMMSKNTRTKKKTKRTEKRPLQARLVSLWPTARICPFCRCTRTQPTATSPHTALWRQQKLFNPRHIPKLGGKKTYKKLNTEQRKPSKSLSKTRLSGLISSLPLLLPEQVACSAHRSIRSEPTFHVRCAMPRVHPSELRPRGPLHGTMENPKVYPNQSQPFSFGDVNHTSFPNNLSAARILLPMQKLRSW